MKDFMDASSLEQNFPTYPDQATGGNIPGMAMGMSGMSFPPGQLGGPNPMMYMEYMYMYYKYMCKYLEYLEKCNNIKKQKEE